MQIRAARQVLTHGATRAGQSLGLAALALLLGSHGLQNAVANGDTRTISLHHIHTGEDLTVTFKRNGRYDDEALKQINHVLRDWRRDEETTMDPRLLDVVWEVYREVDAKVPIQVVCGYRAPATNAMLRRRSNGVAEHSQHMLGRAMDFFIPGVPLETQREAGLRLQRGGVGYYPSSGSPFIHLDVGSVRMWPRMSRAQLAKVFPDGRTVHVPTDGHPLAGYALALADIEQRGSSAPSETSLASARDSGVDMPAAATTPRQRNLFSALFTTKDEDDDSEAAAAAPAPKSDTKASTKPDPKAEKKADKVAQPKPAATKVAEAVPLPVARPAERIAAKVEPKIEPKVEAKTEPKPAPAAAFNLASAESRPVAPTPRKADTTGAVAPWPVRVADAGDSVPPGLALAYSAQTNPTPAAPVTRGLRGPAAQPTRVADAGSEAAPIESASATAPTLKASPPPDDLWLRALVLAPNLKNYLTATVLGQSDLRELSPLMEKPDAVVTMGFGDDPNLGLATDRFAGAAVVFVPTTVFEKKRTAALQ